MLAQGREIPAAVRKYLWRDSNFQAEIILLIIAVDFFFLNSMGRIELQSPGGTPRTHDTRTAWTATICVSIFAAGHGAQTVWRWFRLIRRGVLADPCVGLPRAKRSRCPDI